jgi:hypothetical protein
MIIDFFINAMVSFTKTVFGIMPSVPATPQAIIDGGGWITETIGSVISVLNMLYSPALLAACMVVIIAMFNFELIYHALMWILRKIPMINMK